MHSMESFGRVPNQEGSRQILRPLHPKRSNSSLGTPATSFIIGHLNIDNDSLKFYDNVVRNCTTLIFKYLREEMPIFRISLAVVSRV